MAQKDGIKIYGTLVSAMKDHKLAHADEITVASERIKSSNVKEALEELNTKITDGSGNSPIITIGDNGNWYINGTDTGKPSRGPQGLPGDGGGSSVRMDDDNIYITIGESETTPGAVTLPDDIIRINTASVTNNLAIYRKNIKGTLHVEFASVDADSGYYFEINGKRYTSYDLAPGTENDVVTIVVGRNKDVSGMATLLITSPTNEIEPIQISVEYSKIEPAQPVLMSINPYPALYLDRYNEQGVIEIQASGITQPVMIQVGQADWPKPGTITRRIWTMSYNGTNFSYNEESEMWELVIPAEDFTNNTVTLDVHVYQIAHNDYTFNFNIISPSGEFEDKTMSIVYAYMEPVIITPDFEDKYLITREGASMPYKMAFVTRYVDTDFKVEISSNPGNYYTLYTYYIEDGEENQWNLPDGSIILEKSETNNNDDKHYGIKLVRDDSVHESTEIIKLKVSEVNNSNEIGIINIYYS